MVGKNHILKWCFHHKKVKTISEDITDIQPNRKLNSGDVNQHIMVQRRGKTKRTTLTWRQFPTKDKNTKTEI